jgi:putative endonuclease
MFFTYILKSQKDNKLYFGSTSDLKRRVKEHNSGLVDSTKSRRPLKLVYVEGYAAEEDARKRERNLKLGARAMRQLLNRIKKSLAS